MINAKAWDKIKAIHDRVKQDGTLIKSGGIADVWEFCGIRSAISDGGYGIQITTDKFCAYAQYGSELSGFLRGSERDLNNLLLELGIAAQ